MTSFEQGGVRMKLRELIPGGFKRWIDHIETASRYPDSVQIDKTSKVYPGVSIGEYSYINGNTCVFTGSIGKFCSIGYNVQIGPPEHPIRMNSTHPAFYKKQGLWNEVQDTVSIGHDVWIGSNAVILQGCNVGTGAVIAAGAVVTKDVPPYSIWGGAPAKLIKYRFSQEKIDCLLKSE